MKKSKRETTTLRMHPEIWESTKIQAIRERRSASDIVEDALVLYFSQISQSQAS